MLYHKCRASVYNIFNVKTIFIYFYTSISFVSFFYYTLYNNIINAKVAMFDFYYNFTVKLRNQYL